MSVSEKILEEMNAPEGQTKLKKWALEYDEKMFSKDKKKKEIFSDTNYMKWLENFTIKHPSFASDTWLYFQEQISKEDNENVGDLYLLYEGIDFYANRNYIYPMTCEFGDYYNIKLDNVCYEIGMLIGQGTLFFCNRKPLNKDLEYIDFNDIIDDKKKDGVTTIENGLNQLSNLVVSLYENNVPIEAIIMTLENTLNEIKSQNKSGYTKTLRIK